MRNSALYNYLEPFYREENFTLPRVARTNFTLPRVARTNFVHKTSSPQQGVCCTQNWLRELVVK